MNFKIEILNLFNYMRKLKIYTMLANMLEYFSRTTSLIIRNESFDFPMNSGI